MGLVTVSAGAVLTIAGEPQQSGLVDVVFEALVVAMSFATLRTEGKGYAPAACKLNGAAI